KNFIPCTDVNGLGNQLHDQHIVRKLPYLCLHFKEEITIPKITQKKRPVTISNKILVVAKLKIEVFSAINKNRPPRVQVIHCGCFERLIESFAGHRIKLGDAFTK